jgi:hypothetical protein
MKWFRCGECADRFPRELGGVRPGQRAFCSPRCKCRFHSRLFRHRQHARGQHMSVPVPTLRSWEQESTPPERRYEPSPG